MSISCERNASDTRALQKHWLAFGLLKFYLIGLYLFLAFLYLT